MLLTWHVDTDSCCVWRLWSPCHTYAKYVFGIGLGLGILLCKYLGSTLFNAKHSLNLILNCTALSTFLSVQCNAYYQFHFSVCVCHNIMQFDLDQQWLNTFQGKGMQKTYWLDGRRGLSLPLLSSEMYVCDREPALGVQTSDDWLEFYFLLLACRPILVRFTMCKKWLSFRIYGD